MSKKIFFVTIPMQKPEDLKALRYRKEEEGEIFSEPTAFPGIELIRESVVGNEEIEINVVRTDDENNRSQKNYLRFLDELAAFSEELGKPLTVKNDIILPHSETREKQVELMKRICACYSDGADVYMDVTYGTKVSTIGMFSTLVYAERIRNCRIKTVAYGKYAHNDTDIGEFYDVSCMYEISMLVHAADYMPAEQVDDLLTQLWG